VSRGPDPDDSDADILRIFAESPDPVLFASELADSLDMTRQGVYSRMEKLVDKGFLLTKKPGDRTRVYWISREGKEYLQSQSSSEGNQ
jgi:predicted transcriptional regulator